MSDDQQYFRDLKFDLYFKRYFKLQQIQPRRTIHNSSLNYYKRLALKINLQVESLSYVIWVAFEIF